MIFIAMVKSLGKFVLFLASAAFIVGVSMLILGSWLTTYPLHRQSPRKRQIQSGIELASAGVTFLGAWGDKLQNLTVPQNDGEAEEVERE